MKWIALMRPVRGRELRKTERRRRSAERTAQARLFRKRVANELPDLSHGELRMLTSALQKAQARNIAIAEKRYHAVAIATMWGFVFLAAVMVAYLAHEWTFTPEPTPGPAGLAAIAGLVVGGMATPLLVFTADLRTWRAREPAPTAAAPVPLRERFTGTGWPGAVLLLSVFPPAGALSLLAVGHPEFGIFATALAIGLVTSCGVLAVATVCGNLAVRSMPSQVFDGALTVLAGIVVEMPRLAPARDRADVPRYLVHSLEHLARTACSHQPWGSRAPLTEPAARAAVREPAEAFAAIVRLYKPRVAKPGKQADYERIADHLKDALFKMAADDWESLLANAPVRVHGRMWSYTMRNVLPAVVLGAAAIVLPWLPPFRSHPQSTANIRVTFGAFAVLQLVPRPSLTDLFDKALGRGFDGTKR